MIVIYESRVVNISNLFVSMIVDCASRIVIYDREPIS